MYEFDVSNLDIKFFESTDNNNSYVILVLDLPLHDLEGY